MNHDVYMWVPLADLKCRLTCANIESGSTIYFLSIFLSRVPHLYMVWERCGISYMNINDEYCAFDLINILTNNKTFCFRCYILQ